MGSGHDRASKLPWQDNLNLVRLIRVNRRRCGLRAAASVSTLVSAGKHPKESVSMWPIRSALFVPAHRRDWVGKAIRVSPGAAVLDIEDSVPPDAKPQAMANLREEIAELRAAGVGAFVRVNPLSDRTGEEIAAAMTEGLTAIVLPKAA